MICQHTINIIGMKEINLLLEISIQNTYIYWLKYVLSSMLMTITIVARDFLLVYPDPDNYDYSPALE
jgi:hypothetical protein